MILTLTDIIFGIITLKKNQELPEWEDVLSSAARLQQFLPDAVLVGGTASSIYADHRISCDALAYVKMVMAIPIKNASQNANNSVDLLTISVNNLKNTLVNRNFNAVSKVYLYVIVGIQTIGGFMGVLLIVLHVAGTGDEEEVCNMCKFCFCTE